MSSPPSRSSSSSLSLSTMPGAQAEGYTGSSLKDVVQLMCSPLLDLMNLDHNAYALSVEMDRLREQREALETRRPPTAAAVIAWMDSVDCLSRQVATFQEALDRSGTGCCCLFSCRSYKLARMGADYLKRARALSGATRELGVFSGDVPLVGRERALSKVLRRLWDADIWTRSQLVGIVGMAGVGKTVLLRKVRDEVLAAGTDSPFDAVVWVTVTRHPDIRKIQRDIGAQLGLHLSTPAPGCCPLLESVCERARRLVVATAARRCLLLLDDVWEDLDLKAIGVPYGEKTCKVVYTSRSQNVYRWDICRRLVPVGVLDVEESWVLFRSIVGAAALDSIINPVARQIVDKCGGLPLALVTVGRALADASSTVDVWREALLQLTDSPLDFPGMQKLHPVLDALDPSSRECLEYCSLFPAGHYIPVDQLVQYLVPEGIGQMISSASRLVEGLKGESLLEAGVDGAEYVKMHDLIRHVALRGAAEGKGLWVSAGKGLECVPSGVMGKDAVRVSLMDNNIRDLPDSPDCPKLKTLFLNKNAHLHRIPDTFFHLMPVLRVLDLSSTEIGELPDGVGLLSKLRHLNLSHTTIRSLPVGLGNLKMLQVLDLGYTRELVTIPQTAIIPLERLKKLEARNSAYCWAPEYSRGHGESGIGLKDLNHLQCLEDLRLDVESSSILADILSSDRLSGSVQHLNLQHVEDLRHLPPNFNALSTKLRELCIYECSGLEELAFSGGPFDCLEDLSLVGVPITTIVIEKNALKSLRNLHVFGCHGLQDLTAVCQVQSSLECIDLRVCNGLVELISPQGDQDIRFRKLTRINLYALPQFEGIYGGALGLYALEHLEVWGCPMFMDLSRYQFSLLSIKQILGEQEWWESLTWDRSATKQRFLPYFKDKWLEEEQEQQYEDTRRKQSGGGEGSGGTHS